MRTALTFIIATAICSGFALGEVANGKKRNVVLIYIDDWAWK